VALVHARLLLVLVSVVSPTTGPSVERPPTVVSVTVSGDVLTHTSLWESAATGDGGYDFTPNFAALRPVLAGEVDICHLETPLTAGAPRSYPSFATPWQLAPALRSAGFEGCSTASNHSLDRGGTGVSFTLRTLERAGLKHSGMRTKRTDPGWALYTTRSGAKVANLSFTFSTNGVPLPSDAPWAVNMLHVNRVIAVARAAGRVADVVVVSLHWGTEYQEAPNAAQKRIAEELAASGEIDLIVGHHAHVLQPAAMVGGIPVLYGMGNLWSGQGPWSGREFGDIAAVAELRFSVQSGRRPTFLGGSFTPTTVTPADWRVGPADSRGRGCLASRHAVRLLGRVLEPVARPRC
jgi:hypothetical protein